jgi:hypothetical protein
MLATYREEAMRMGNQDDLAGRAEAAFAVVSATAPEWTAADSASRPDIPDNSSLAHVDDVTGTR